MKTSSIQSYDDLPLFLNVNLVAQVLGVSISTAYEVMHEPGFPVLRVGSRMGSTQGKVHSVGRGAGGRREMKKQTWTRRAWKVLFFKAPSMRGLQSRE